MTELERKRHMEVRTLADRASTMAARQALYVRFNGAGRGQSAQS